MAYLGSSYSQAPSFSSSYYDSGMEDNSMFAPRRRTQVAAPVVAPVVAAPVVAESPVPPASAPVQQVLDRQRVIDAARAAERAEAVRRRAVAQRARRVPVVHTNTAAGQNTAVVYNQNPYPGYVGGNGLGGPQALVGYDSPYPHVLQGGLMDTTYPFMQVVSDVLAGMRNAGALSYPPAQAGTAPVQQTTQPAAPAYTVRPRTRTARRAVAAAARQPAPAFTISGGASGAPVTGSQYTIAGPNIDTAPLTLSTTPATPLDLPNYNALTADLPLSDAIGNADGQITNNQWSDTATTALALGLGGAALGPLAVGLADGLAPSAVSWLGQGSLPAVAGRLALPAGRGPLALPGGQGGIPLTMPPTGPSLTGTRVIPPTITPSGSAGAAEELNFINSDGLLSTIRNLLGF